MATQILSPGATLNKRPGGPLCNPMLFSNDELRRIVTSAWNNHRPDIAAYYLAALNARLNGRLADG